MSQDITMKIKTLLARLLKSRLLWPILIYLLLACLAYWPVQPLSSSHVVTCGCYDIAEQAWFLAWTPHAILNGINPFFTHALNYPYGANLAANTTMPLLGIFFAPITLLLGPISTFNLLIRLALALSATSMFLVLRRYVRYNAICFIGGLLYGFSPYMVAQSSLHLNLSFVALFPWMLVALDNLLIQQKHTPRRDGLILGLLATGQYFISSELLADFVILCLVAVMILAIFNPRTAREKFFYSLYGLVWSFVPLILIAGYPIVFSLKGPEHVLPLPPVTDQGKPIAADLLSPVIPTSHQIIGTSAAKQTGNSFIISPGENGAYIGIPMLAMATFLLIYLRKNRVLRYLGVMTLVAFVISLGPQLYINGTAQNIWLPFSLFTRITALSLDIPSRYMLFVYMVLAIFICIGLTELYQRIELHLKTKNRPAPVVRLESSVLIFLISAIALVPLLPALPHKEAKVNIPTYFSTAQVNKIPAGSTVLTYPYPISNDNFSMLWQTQSGFRFNILGGYVFIPVQKNGPPGAGLGGGDIPRTLNPALVQVMFEEGYAGVPKGVAPPPPLPWAFDQINGFFNKYHVSTLVVDPIGADPHMVVNFFTDMFGKPYKYGKMDIWYNVNKRKILSQP